MVEGEEEKWTTEDEMVGRHHRSLDMSLSKFWEIVEDWEAWHVAIQGVAKSQIQLSNRTTLTELH